MNCGMIKMLCAAALCLQASLAVAEEHLVLITSDYENMRFAFDPPTLTVQAGDSVTWINTVPEEHNVITYPGGFPKGAQGFASPYFQETGDRFTHTFTVEGTYQYHCLPHLMMGMRGEVVVGQRTDSAGFHEPSREEIMAYRGLLLEWFDEEDNLMQIRVDQKFNR